MGCTPVIRRGPGLVWMAAGLCASALLPRARADGPYVPWTGPVGITEPMARILARQDLQPTWRIAASPRLAPDRSGRYQNPAAPAVPHWPWSFAGGNPPTVLPGGFIDNPQTISPTQNFLSVTMPEASGLTPPDTTGAVGPAQFVVFVNGRLRAFEKATGAAVLSVDADTFFDSVRGGAPTAAPNARYDTISQRWFLTVITTTGHSNRVLIARSDGPVLSAATVFTFFYFQQDAVAPAGNTGQFLDSPSLGIDANALYIGGNMFASGTGSFANTSAWVVNKSSVLGPGPLAATAFRDLLISNIGPFAPRGVDNPDPAAAEGYLIGVDNAFFGLLQMRRISNPGGNPSISPNIPLTVPATVFPIDVASSGGWPAADALDDRLFAAQIRRDRLTGQTTLTTAHNIQVSATGVASNTGGRNGSRWYQIGDLATTPTLVQAGTLFDSAAANPRSYWIPSIAMSGQGHLAMGCSSAASNTLIGCCTGGRIASDPPGTIQWPTTIAPGAGTYINNAGRFGEYSATVVDPSDDQSIWTFQEYMSANGVWGVRAARLLAPPPALPVLSSPASVSAGQSGAQVVITGSAAGGAGFYDTEPGLSRVQAAFSGVGIVVTQIVWTDPTHLTLTVDVSPTAATGGRSLVVTNPDGQQADSGSPILTIDPPAVCPAFTTNPDALSICAGSAAQFVVAATGVPAPSFQWRRNMVPLVDGGSIAGSATPTLRIDPALPADAGVYDCIATNSCGGTPSLPAALTVDSTPVLTGQSGGLSVWPGQAAQFTVSSTGATSYQWRRNSAPLSNGGSISGALSGELTINPVQAADAGLYDCLVSNGCGSVTSQQVQLAVSSCYANCDNSTIPPVLNILDFVCFLNTYAAGNTRANCDGSTVIPILNVLDFSCFLNRYATGCP